MAISIGLDKTGLHIDDSVYPYYLFGFVPLMLWVSFYLDYISNFNQVYVALFYCSEALCLLTYAAIPSIVGKLLSAWRRQSAITVIALLLLALLAPLFPLPNFSFALGLVGSVCGALVFAFGLLVVYSLHVSLGLRAVTEVVTVSFVAVPVIRLPLMLIGSAAMGIVGSLGVLIFTLGAVKHLEHEDIDKSGKTEADHQPPERQSGYVALVVLLCAFGLCMGMLRLGFGVVAANIPVLIAALAAQIVLPLCLLAYFYNHASKASLGMLCQFSLVLMLLMFSGMLVFRDNMLISGALSGSIRYFAYLVLYFCLCALPTRSSSPAYATFCIGWGLYSLMVGFGNILFMAAGSVVGKLDGPILGVMSVLTVLMFFFFNMDDKIDISFFGSPTTARSASLVIPVTLEAHCKELGLQKGLTDRETEIMVLLCKARSKRYIAEELMLSENTVKTYAKTLYAKLEVHSRQELLTLVEEYGSK